VCITEYTYTNSDGYDSFRTMVMYTTEQYIIEHIVVHPVLLSYWVKTAHIHFLTAFVVRSSDGTHWILCLRAQKAAVGMVTGVVFSSETWGSPFKLT
jgi:hypothetical protein